MKKLLLIFLPILLLYGCSSEMLFDTDRLDISTTTRGVALDSSYYFKGYTSTGEVEDIVCLPFKTDSINRTMVSYKETNFAVTDLLPEVQSKPEWVNKVIFYHAYYKIYEIFICVDANTSAEKRVGKLVLKQPESNKTFSIGITQNGINNYTTIKVNKTYKNQYEFTATTTYPVEGEIRIRVPLIVYNDGGELAHDAVIVIAKGEKTGSYLMDWNASPLVAHHGDIKGYRLYEGEFWGENNVYTYRFVRYW